MLLGLYVTPKYKIKFQFWVAIMIIYASYVQIH